MRAILGLIVLWVFCIPQRSLAGETTPPSDPADVDFFVTGSRSGCPPFNVTFVPDWWDDMGDPYISQVWHFGDGATSTDFSPTHTYTTQGKFTVTLVAIKMSGIKDTLAKLDYINTLSSFTVDIGPDTTICSGASIVLDATTPGATSYLWSDGTTTAQLETFFEGEYWVEVNKGGCLSYDTIYVTVGPQLAADFTWNSDYSCSPILAEFTDLSQSCMGSITEWLWDFGDGSTSAEQNPVHEYAAPGDYTVVLTVKNSIGNFTSQSYDIYIDGDITPVVSLPDDFALCQDSTVVLDAGNPGADYLWSNGATSQTILATGGHKYVVLVTNNGCSATDSVTISEVPSVRAAFSVTQQTNCLPVQMQFQDESIHCGGEITMWYWEFSDGSYSYDQHPQHAFTTAGDHTVKLTIFHEWGDISDTTVIIHVAPLNVQVNLGGDTTICEGETLTLNAGNPGADYVWSTGETTQEIIAAFEGEYAVKVTYMGCEATDTLRLQLRPAVEVNYDYNVEGDCLPVSVSFADASTVNCSQSINSWLWEFGDGGTSTDPNPVHSYQSEGNFTVKLTITTSGGSSSSHTRNVSVTNTVPALEMDDEVKICKGAPFQLDAGLDQATYSWWPSAGLNDPAIRNPIATPPSSGYYYVDVTRCMVTQRDSILIILDSIAKPTITQEGNTLKTGNAVTYQWYREGIAIPGATGKTLKADRRGYYTVKVFNGTGCEKESNSFFFLPVSGKEKGQETRVKCSPNPVTNGVINVLLSRVPNKPAKVNIYDSHGRQMMKAQVSGNVNPLYAPHLRKGIYMVEVLVDDKRFVVPVAVQ